MFKKMLLVTLLVVSFIITACGSAPASTPVPTATPFPMMGCNAIKDADGMLWFDESHQGEPFVISESGYVYQPYFFAYFRADCVQGYPRVVLGSADTNCIDQDVRWETDGGWSCTMQGGYWTFQAGGSFLWPRGKPDGYVEPRPIIPEFPTPEPPQNPNQQG